MADEDDDDAPLDAGDFHTIAQKQIINAVFATLAESKMQWNLVEPLLEAGRSVSLGDFTENARIRLHTQRAEGDDWVPAEEAYLGISVADRETGEEWLSETYWLSDIAIADGNRAEVEEIVAGLERTIAKLREWLANPAAPPPEAEAPPEEPQA
ncbi:MAG: hypothetical protein JO276_17360 [Sphingomonadaceae bacterium]|nr:hypothetical protein [Sphingomonadaceae bacterium]